MAHKTYWGRAGAGILFYCEEDNTYLLGLRSDMVLDPHVWGIPGGSVSGEALYSSRDTHSQRLPDIDFWNGAVNEVYEECGELPPNLSYANVDTFTDFKDGSFVYRTFLYKISLKDKASWVIEPNYENEEFEWFDVEHLPKKLHKGVKYTLSVLNLKPNPMELNAESLVLQKQISALEYLAEMYDVSLPTLLEALDSPYENPQIQKYSDSDVKHFIEKGATKAQIKIVLNINYDRIERVAEVNNLVVAKKRTISDDELLSIYHSMASSEIKPVSLEVLAELYRAGARVTQIERLLATSNTRIYRALFLAKFQRDEHGQYSNKNKDPITDDQVLQKYAELIQPIPLSTLEQETESDSQNESDEEASDIKEDIEITTDEKDEYDASKESDFIPYAYKKGVSLLTLAQFCKQSIRNIKAFIHDAGEAVRPAHRGKGKPLTEDDVKDIWSSFVLESNDILESVAQELNIDRTIVLETSLNDLLNQYGSNASKRLAYTEKLVEMTPILTKLQIVLLRQKGLSYQNIMFAEADMNLAKRSQKFQVDAIAKILEDGIPEDIDADTYLAAVRSVESYLSKGKRRRVKFEYSTIEKHHYLEYFFDLTPADIEFIIYLNQKYLLNLCEIRLYVYNFITIDKLRELFASKKIKPTRFKQIPQDTVRDILSARESLSYSLEELAKDLKIAQERILFFTDYFLNGDLKTKRFESNGAWRGDFTYSTDTVRNLSSLQRQEILSLYMSNSSITANEIATEFSSYNRKLDASDIRSLLYIRGIPLRMDAEFGIPTMESDTHTDIEEQVPQRQDRQIIAFKPEDLQVPIPRPIVQPPTQARNLYPLSQYLSILDMERVVDLNHTFGLTLSEIEKFEYIGVPLEDLAKSFAYENAEISKNSEVSRERASRIEKAFTKVKTLQEVFEIYSTIPIEKIKYLMRKGFIKIRNLDRVVFDFKPFVRQILDTDFDTRVEIETQYERGMSSAELAYLYELGSRKAVRRILHESPNVELRIEDEIKLIDGFEELKN